MAPRIKIKATDARGYYARFLSDARRGYKRAAELAASDFCSDARKLKDHIDARVSLRGAFSARSSSLASLKRLGQRTARTIREHCWY